MSNELTPAEVLATKLFGWKCDDSKNNLPERDREYSRISDAGYTQWACIKIERGEEIFGERSWPDFTDERLAWYWIRRVEDALRALDKDLFDDYMICVTRKCDYDRRDAWLATVAQRLEAATRVIKEAGL
jgi:hypothetical protein